MRFCLFGWLIFTYFLGSCITQQNSRIFHDYRYGVQFSEYRTFSLFANLEAHYPPSVNTALIEHTIAKRMELLGYKYQVANPDIIIGYSILAHKTKFQGYSQINHQSAAYLKQGKNEYNPETYKLMQGSLLIHIIDFNTQECIWQGYLNNNENTTELSEDRRMTYMITQIIEQYRLFTFNSMGVEKYAVKKSQ